MKNGILLVLLLSVTACNRNRLDVDVSGVEVQKIKVLRLEKDLFALNESNFEQNAKAMSQRYGAFYQKFLVNPLKTNALNDPNLKSNVLTFTHDREIKEAYDQAQYLYPDSKIEELSDQLTVCNQRFKYHFPKRKLPLKLITCITGWNYAFAYTDNALVVGLDMYLGEGCNLYKMLAYPQYQTRKMNEQHLLPDIARGWLLTEFDNANPVNNLLNHTIFYGKLYYGVKALLPETNDSLIIGYTTKQMNYCTEYEKKLWSYFAEKNRLYENDMKLVRELTSEGPFTGSIHKDCPPRIAMWLGWQIVKSYMDKNESVTLEDLMTEEDAQKILSKSKYRP